MACFWTAYVLTRPLGASVADYLGKPRGDGGLGWGAGWVALGFTALIVAVVARRAAQVARSRAARAAGTIRLMPAVTVDNPLELPRAASPAEGHRARRVTSVTTAPRGLEGEGFPVRRAFDGIDLADLDPFVHMDQMGEVDYGPGEPKGTPWHPHRGFETVTYMIDGTFLHQDSIGGGGVIQNGATQWMTAGAGILHIERPPDALIDSGGLFHGIQLWVNLPARLKMTHPRYQDIEAGQVDAARPTRTATRSSA